MKILVTGGTFDKEYNELNGTLFFRETHVEDVLKKGRCALPITIHKLMLIDSLDMDGGGRTKILDYCKDSEDHRIVITHGTDTMVETAAFLSQIKNKTIVLTGAMIPYMFGSSDGLFNMGSALAFVQTLPSGVYIAMNGKYFSWDNVEKNKLTGKFEEKTSFV